MKTENDKVLIEENRSEQLENFIAEAFFEIICERALREHSDNEIAKPNKSDIITTEQEQQ